MRVWQTLRLAHPSQPNRFVDNSPLDSVLVDAVELVVKNPNAFRVACLQLVSAVGDAQTRLAALPVVPCSLAGATAQPPLVEQPLLRFTQDGIGAVVVVVRACRVVFLLI